ncbi:MULTISPECIES: SpoIIAA family protein [Massilia]|uniref:STAS/SEC14 domain-containing protein n=1 Tax=Massilia haematophila TaxID=457923 RepID=A0ABV7PGF8_9BURK|nr:STAS/SEC14 domain-containing protein [Massilia sp.]
MMETTNAASGLRVEVAGDVLLVVPPDRMTEAALRLCQDRMLALARETGLRRVLYDARGMSAPEAHIALMQQELDGQLGDLKLRRAIVVPGTRIAYLARIAFFEGEDRVFYDDVEAALAWLRS